ncbi:protein modification by small protein conjugation or removal [Coemansia sp. RSA 989]|nr:hypothetical protein BX667DRAFT_499595 [Coemansia mojavensis]KAJ1741567.1 protein modification by small protein conjugation or removal [Coemansia sp. RSA 1086]KAJ1749824.1 protein modification by small protein conjugation or removal [Coemansia sp. RSA 1821]KAJ1864109.1 protein modification by small protein conjugation or removal [Coemansia sp. RSA 989]KAJ1871799.1 protein modification by small protein conjugation or removal [Coemansia sp. RSA 990]KAJ2668884.1 protein modification by small p
MSLLPESTVPSAPLLRQERTSVIDFGELTPQYHAPMHYPTEVDLYEPLLDVRNVPQHRHAGQKSTRVETDVPLACGYFNIWRPLYDRRVPVAQRLARFFTGSAALQKDGRVVTPEATWDNRISYSSADDDYYENGHALPVIKGWNHGMLTTKGIFRKVEHDWMMTYLAPTNDRDDTQPLAVWRFNYSASRRVIEQFHAVLSFTIFDESAAIEWCIRPLSHRSFRKIPIRILSLEEAACFPEIAANERKPADNDHVLEKRARIIERYRGQILVYRSSGDNFNDYVVHTVPALATDLSEYVVNDFGFELAVSCVRASSGSTAWQKVQIARQSLHHPVSGRIREGEDAMSRCGLDFRIKLCDEIVVAAAPPLLTSALTANNSGACLRMDDASGDFTIYIQDPENTVGSLQPPIRAHEQVLRAGSDYFAALLGSDMSESASKQVVLNDMPYGPVRTAIYYLYVDKVANEDSMDVNDWIVLMSVASRLSILRLHQLCQARILDDIVQETYCLSSDAPTSKASSICQDPAVFPDMETVESLRSVAIDTGAYDLIRALNRLVTYYTIDICENRIRNESADQRSGTLLHNNDFVPPHVRDVHDFLSAVGGPHFNHLPGAHFGHGPVHHPEFFPNAPDHEEDGGIIAHLHGNWRLTNVHQNHADPPAPQPGPVPHVHHQPTNMHLPHPESGDDSESE